VKGQDRPLSRELNATFEAVCRAILEKHGDLGGVAVHTDVEAANYALVPRTANRRCSASRSRSS
jgi:hypothetical protein